MNHPGTGYSLFRRRFALAFTQLLHSSYARNRAVRGDLARQESSNACAHPLMAIWQNFNRALSPLANNSLITPRGSRARGKNHTTLKKNSGK